MWLVVGGCFLLLVVVACFCCLLVFVACLFLCLLVFVAVACFYFFEVVSC